MPQLTQQFHRGEYGPFLGLFDTLIDIAESETARRAALTDEERATEDRLAEEQKVREQELWLAEHAKHVELREDREENDRLVWAFTTRERRQLRDRDYELDQPEGIRVWFRAYDRKWYPFEFFRHYDVTGELPVAQTAPNPVATHFWAGLLDRVEQRGIGTFGPIAREVAPKLSREQRVADELDRLLALHDEGERRRAMLNPEERAAEDREIEVLEQKATEDAEREKRTMIRVRRDGDDTILKLSRDELVAKGFQLLFALRCGKDDVYFVMAGSPWVSSMQAS